MIGACQSIFAHLQTVFQTGRAHDMKLRAKGEVRFMCELHAGEVEVLQKGVNVQLGRQETGKAQYCCGKGRRHKPTNFLSPSASRIKLAEVCDSRC